MERRPLRPGWRFKCTQQRAQVQLAEILQQGQRTPGAVRGAENEKKMFSESRRRDRDCVLLLICLSLGKKEENTKSVAIFFFSLAAATLRIFAKIGADSVIRLS